MDIDAIIAEAAASQEKPAIEETKEEPKEELQEEAKEVEEAPEEKSKEDDVARENKKLKNAISKKERKIAHRDRKIGQFQAERIADGKRIKELEAQIAQLSKGGGDAPKETDFETYGQYLNAVAKYHAQQANKEAQLQGAEAEAKEIQEKAAAKEAEFRKEVEQAAQENLEKAIKELPDFVKIFEEHSDELKSLPPETIDILYQAPNGSYALYSILKEGALDDLTGLSPMQAAMFVARHEDKGLAAAKVKKVSTAPDPMAPAKGTGSAGKSLEQMSAKEVLAVARSG